MDVWFDSGSSWAGVVQAGEGAGLRFPADLYLEGSDQHRGAQHSARAGFRVELWRWRLAELEGGLYSRWCFIWCC